MIIRLFALFCVVCASRGTPLHHKPPRQSERVAHKKIKKFFSPARLSFRLSLVLFVLREGIYRMFQFGGGKARAGWKGDGKIRVKRILFLYSSAEAKSLREKEAKKSIRVGLDDKLKTLTRRGRSFLAFEN